LIHAVNALMQATSAFFYYSTFATAQPFKQCEMKNGISASAITHVEYYENGNIYSNATLRDGSFYTMKSMKLFK